jgi:hypothetical protein
MTHDLDKVREVMGNTCSCLNGSDDLLTALTTADPATRLALARAVLPEGWVCVPREATDAMCDAAVSPHAAESTGAAQRVWDRMIAAAGDAA